MFKNLFGKINLKNKEILIKMILSLAIPTILTMVIIPIFFSYLFTKESVTDISSSNLLTLSNIDNSFSDILDISQQTAYEIYNNLDIKQVRYSEDYSHDDILKAAAYLKNIIDSRPAIFSIDLFVNNKKVLDFQRNANYLDNPKDILQFINNVHIFTPYPRRIKGIDNSIMNCITTAYTEDPTNRNGTYVIVNVSTDELYRKIDSQYLQAGQRIIAVSNNGYIIVSSNKSEFLKQINDLDYFKDSLNSTTDFGNISTKIDGKNSIVNYLHSTRNKYILYSLNNYDVYFSHIVKIRNIIILVCILLLILLILTMIFISYRFYTPINNIFSSIKTLVKGDNIKSTRSSELDYVTTAVINVTEKLYKFERDNSKNFNLLKYNFLYKLFITNNFISEKDYYKNLIEYNIVENVENLHQIIVLRIDNYKKFITENSLESVSAQLVSIETSILDIFPSDFKCSVTTIELKHIILITDYSCESQISDLNNIYNNLNNLKNTVLKLFNISITVGISSIFNGSSMNELRRNYIKAYNLTNYRFIYGNGFIYDSTYEYSPIENNDKIKHIVDKILGYVKSGKFIEFQENIDLLFNELKKYGYKKTVHGFLILAQEMIWIPSELSINFNNDNEENFFEEFKDFQDYSELKLWFIELYNKINNLITALKNCKTQDFINSVINYIDDRYNDSSISASLVAENLSITPQYFSKIFKQYTGYSFPDYVNNLRLEKAKEILLSNPLINKKDLCEKIGYNSESYFSTSFTKKFGVSPTKYVLIKKNN